jgi:hypothetical protein
MRFALVRCAAAVSLALALLGPMSACGGSGNYIRGTTVTDTNENREIIAVIEAYRVAVEKRDAAALVRMASKSYWEDGGTPTGGDDYGYDGLREVLAGRFQRAADIRYSMKYLKVTRKGSRAAVEVYIDASYTVAGEAGEQRMDHRDQNEMLLEWDGQSWLFLSGM